VRRWQRRGAKLPDNGILSDYPAAPRGWRWFCQQQADRCLGSSDMTNACELLQPSLRKASQSCCQAWTKRYVVVVSPGSWRGTLNLAPSGHRQGLRHSCCGSEHGKPVGLPAKASSLRSGPSGMRVWDGRESEGRSVIERIGVATSPRKQVRPLLPGLSSREELLVPQIRERT
jgi:hypothetical protein